MSIVNVKNKQKSKLNAQTFDTVLCSRSRLRALQPNLGFVVIHDDSNVDFDENIEVSDINDTDFEEVILFDEELHQIVSEYRNQSDSDPYVY